MKIYMAGPLFTIQDRRFLEEMRDAILAKNSVSIFLPHVDNEDNAKGHMDSTREQLNRIFTKDYEAILRSDLMIAFLDGVPLDCGTTWEMGFAFANKIPIIGVRTDFRILGNFDNQKFDLMAEGSCHEIIFRPRSNFSELAHDINSALIAIKEKK